MRSASILLALVVVVGFVSYAPAKTSPPPDHDFTFEVAGNLVGFRDWRYTTILEGPQLHSVINFGPFGWLEVPFTATQGLVGFCALVIGMLALATMGTFRWRRKRVA
jgi:hypothetical protein